MKAQLWLTYPMGGAAAERMQLRGLDAYLDHAVELKTMKPMCSVKIHSLCMDDSLAEATLPNCPKCRAAIVKRFT